MHILNHFGSRTFAKSFFYFWSFETSYINFIIIYRWIGNLIVFNIVNVYLSGIFERSFWCAIPVRTRRAGDLLKSCCCYYSPIFNNQQIMNTCSFEEFCCAACWRNDIDVYTRSVNDGSIKLNAVRSCIKFNSFRQLKVVFFFRKYHLTGLFYCYHWRCYDQFP